MNAVNTARTMDAAGQFETHLTDKEATDVLKRIPADHRDRGFANDLLEKGDRYGLSVKQLAWVHKLALRQLAWESKPAAEPVRASVWATRKFPNLVKFLDPVSKKLKSGANVRFDGWSVSRCRSGSQWNGHYWVSNGAEFGSGLNRLYGRITPAGEFVPHGANCAEPPAEVLAELDLFEKNPMVYTREFGVKTGRCCFCNLALTDDKSAVLGYGPVCAKNYGLPHGKKGMLYWGLSQDDVDAMLAKRTGGATIEDEPEPVAMNAAGTALAGFPSAVSPRLMPDVIKDSYEVSELSNMPAAAWKDEEGWPAVFELHGRKLYVHSVSKDREGDVEKVTYRVGTDGKLVTVWND